MLKSVRAMARKHGLEQVDKDLCRKNARAVMEAFDSAYANKLRRRARKVVYSTGRRTQRPQQPSLKVGEAYCPARLTAVAADYGLEPAFVMDLTVVDQEDGRPWDFDDEEIQQKALKRIERDDPGIVLVSPECSPFCTLQEWNHPRMTEESVRTHAESGIRHVAFAVMICILQCHRGRCVVF